MIDKLERQLAADRRRASVLRAEIEALEGERSRLLGAEVYGLRAGGDLGALDAQLAERRAELQIIEARLPAGEAELQRLEAEWHDDSLERALADLGLATTAWLQSKRATLTAYFELGAAQDVEAEAHRRRQELFDRVRALGGKPRDTTAFFGSPEKQLSEVERRLELEVAR